MLAHALASCVPQEAPPPPAAEGTAPSMKLALGKTSLGGKGKPLGGKALGLGKKKGKKGAFAFGRKKGKPAPTKKPAVGLSSPAVFLWCFSRPPRPSWRVCVFSVDEKRHRS